MVGLKWWSYTWTTAIPVPTAEWEGSLGTSGGELLVGGEAGAQLAALYESNPRPPVGFI